VEKIRNNRLHCSRAEENKAGLEIFRGAVWLRLERIGLLYGRPKFESRLGTPEEALYRADAMRIPRVILYE
jgi:hypothetical protein